MPLKVQGWLKCLDQEACLQLIYRVSGPWQARSGPSAFRVHSFIEKEALLTTMLIFRSPVNGELFMKMTIFMNNCSDFFCDMRSH